MSIVQDICSFDFGMPKKYRLDLVVFGRYLTMGLLGGEAMEVKLARA